jgi:hypothetical protein
LGEEPPSYDVVYDVVSRLPADLVVFGCLDRNEKATARRIPLRNSPREQAIASGSPAEAQRTTRPAECIRPTEAQKCFADAQKEA